MTLQHRIALALTVGTFLFGCTVERPIDTKYLMFCAQLNKGFARCDNDEVVCYVINSNLSCFQKD